jgi:hypothetical protein
MNAAELIAAAFATGMGTRVVLWVLSGFYSLVMHTVRKEVL